ncbi:MAG: prephenate dehydrogenase/arogenate dehydrogenase family protein [Betaproteobacteria bacterium]
MSAAPFRINTLALVGVGLIGGSFALALKKAGMVGRVIGVGRSAANLEKAREMGIIDEVVADAGVAAARADLVLVAVPVAQTGAVFRAIASQLAPGCVVTDAGSTKQDVVVLARAAFGAKLGQFVPAHPIAGAENSGAAAARAELYQGRKVVITPLPETAPAALERVRAAWLACGAQLHSMQPAEHDAVFAAVSHLPHLLAYALVHEVALHDNAATLFDYAASGFRDFTRIASSHPEMWRDICVANRGAILAELKRYQGQLGELQAMLEAGDAAALEAVFERARSARELWLKRQ